MKALVFNTAVCQICEDANIFEVHEDMKWIDCSAEVTEEWTYVNGKFKKPEKVTYDYSLERRLSYPTIGDQLDALFKAGLFPEEMASQIQAIKDKYPKPEA